MKPALRPRAERCHRPPRRILFIVLVLLGWGGLPASSLPAQTPASGGAAAPATGTRGIVSTAHPLATRVGLEVLAQGGNAFDDAVAVAAALNVVEPMMSGMGGYGTVLVHSVREERSLFLNTSGRIPRGVDPNAYRPPTPGYEENRRGAKAVSTPGNVNGWWAISREFGVVGWSRLLKPAVDLAREGFVVDERTSAMIERAWEEFPRHARGIYGTDGRPLRAGERLVQTDLARSLELVALEGPEAFHGGELGEAVDRAMRDADGFLRLSDLEENEAEWYEPIEIPYRGHRVLVPSPPANSFPALVRLGMMSVLDVAAMGFGSVDYLHHYAEVTKHAFWTRLRWAGDPEVAPPPLDRLLSPTYWGERVREIDPMKATPFEPPGNPMDAFPGRHKLSGDVPLFVLRDDRPWIAVGTPGGHTIAQTVPQIVMNMLDFGMNIQEAIAAPRIAFVEPDALAVEEAVPEAVRDQLEARGH